MDFEISKKLEKATENKYEAVIIAARVARRINLARLAAAEQAGAEALPKYPLKVTTEALSELADGEVKFKYREEAAGNDELFSQ
jgi:DNA-directed RNA polymerase subunit K/omega